MIILLSGSDSYRIQQKLNKYKKRFLRDIDSTGINIETLEGEEVTTESFRKAVLSGGLFVKKRLVIIRNLFSNCKDKGVFREIEDYASREKMNTDNILIFIEITSDSKHQTSPASSISSNLFKLLQKQKFSEEFRLLTGVKLNQWVKKEIEGRGGKITNEAIQTLIAGVGSDLWQMSNEIDKLIAYKGMDREIRKEDVEMLVRAKVDENIFNLTDAFGRKDKVQALKLFSDQLNSGVFPPYLLVMLARQIKILLQIKTALDLGVAQYALARKLGLHPFVIQKSASQARVFTFEQLKKIHDRLLDIDIKLKTTNIEPEVLFDLLVTQIDTNF